MSSKYKVFVCLSKKTSLPSVKTLTIVELALLMRRERAFVFLLMMSLVLIILSPEGPARPTNLASKSPAIDVKDCSKIR